MGDGKGGLQQADEPEVEVMEDEDAEVSEFSEDEDDEQIENVNIEEILDAEDLESYKLPYRIPCAAHRMSNIAKVDSEEAMKDPVYKRIWRSTDAKAQALFKKQSFSTKAADSIREKCGGLFKLPNATRWGSEHAAYNRLNEMMDKSDDNLNSLMDEFKFGRFSPAEINFIKDYLIVYEPFVRALNVFQGEQTCHIGVLLPVLTHLKKTLHTLSMNNGSCKSLAAALIKGIDKRFSADFMNDKFYIAAGG